MRRSRKRPPVPMTRPRSGMHSPRAADVTEGTALDDRRHHRVQLPDCPSCRVPLQVDIRSSDTLYARCQWCGHRRMVAKPGTAQR